jgi:Putative peptidoglycan binding domain
MREGVTEGNHNRRKSMKTKGLVFVSCLAAGALIAAPAMGKPAKKSSVSKAKRVAPQTTQVMRHNQNTSARTSGTRYYGGTRYSGTRSYAGRQYSGTGYYNGTPRYRANTSDYRYGSNYYGGTQNYYGGGYRYGSSSVWPYVAASVAPYVASSLSNPYSYHGGYPYNNSYYGSGDGYGYAGSTVASVQRRLGEFGYYHGVADGVIGPRTRSAIAAFQSRNGLVVDGTISRPLLNRLGLA